MTLDEANALVALVDSRLIVMDLAPDNRSKSSGRYRLDLKGRGGVRETVFYMSELSDVKVAFALEQFQIKQNNIEARLKAQEALVDELTAGYGLKVNIQHH